jgi:hypothetical protein
LVILSAKVPRVHPQQRELKGEPDYGLKRVPTTSSSIRRTEDADEQADAC